MEFSRVITERESIRNYDPGKPLPEDTLVRILEAGRMAPSAANLQPWTFLVVTSQEMLQLVRKCYERPWFHDAPVILIVKGSRSDAWKRYDGYNSLETDLTIAMDHMILAAENEGVGTCWIAHFNHELLRKVLNLSPEEEVFAITPLGYPREGFTKKGTKNRRPFHEVVKFI